MRLVKKFLSLILSGSLLISGCGFVKAKKINKADVTSSQTTQVEKKSEKVVSDDVTTSRITRVAGKYTMVSYGKTWLKALLMYGCAKALDYLRVEEFSHEPHTNLEVPCCFLESCSFVVTLCYLASGAIELILI